MFADLASPPYSIESPADSLHHDRPPFRHDMNSNTTVHVVGAGKVGEQLLTSFARSHVTDNLHLWILGDDATLTPLGERSAPLASAFLANSTADIAVILAGIEDSNSLQVVCSIAGKIWQADALVIAVLVDGSGTTLTALDTTRTMGFVDALITLPNAASGELHAVLDDHIAATLTGLSHAFHVNTFIRANFDDFRNVFWSGGLASLGTGHARGSMRAILATEAAIEDITATHLCDTRGDFLWLPARTLCNLKRSHLHRLWFEPECRILTS